MFVACASKVFRAYKFDNVFSGLKAGKGRPFSAW